MQSRIPVRYAKAIFELAKEKNALEGVKDDVTLLFATLSESNELNSFLLSPIIKTSKKKEVMGEIFNKSLKEKMTSEFIELVIENKRESYLLDIARFFITKYKEEKGIVTVKFTTASEMTSGIEESVKDVITKKYNAEVDLQSNVNKDLIGGFVLRVDDIQWDASVSNKLREIKRDLVNTTFEKKFIKTVDPSKNK
jgi:F-type H+-transporting ATPase subunit delta